MTVSVLEIVGEFRKAIEQAGLTPPATITADGKLHRFASNGNPDDDAGWYVLHDDEIPTGIFGDWRTGVNETWTLRNGHRLTETERAAHRARVEALQRQRDEEEQQRHAAAAAEAKRMWQRAKHAPDDHPYLKRKQICLLFGGPRVNREGALVIPLWDAHGKLWSLQFIAPDGEKLFLAGGRVLGCFDIVGAFLIHADGSHEHPLCIAEGYATGVSVHKATGYPVAVAFHAGNLLPVAQVLRVKHPHVQIILCCDHDQSGVGQAKAKEAAEAIGARTVIPDTEGMDWNDVHVKLGLDAVKAAITGAKQAPYSYGEENTAHLHRCPALAKTPNILALFEHAIGVCGVVGEVRCAKLSYLAVTSRLLSGPVSLIVKGLSSSGKSFTTQQTLRFFPLAAYISMTAMSERALVYRKEEFSHRTIVIYEAVALREQREKTESNLTAYFVRSLISEGRISYDVTVKDKDGGFVTKTIVKEGPTNMIVTTTAIAIHGENETRLISIPTNDTREQTKAVMERLAAGTSDTVDMTEWHALQDWLTKAEHRVAIPYALFLAKNIPPLAVRLRRDFKALLGLIETHAILHQCSRDKTPDGHIVASPADYYAVRELVADLLSSGVEATVSDTMRETVQVVKDKDDGTGVTVLVVTKALKLERSAAHRRVKAAHAHGYLTILEEKRGKQGLYAVGDALPDEVELLPLTLPDDVCMHRSGSVQPPKNNVSPQDDKAFQGGVQVCNENLGGNEEPPLSQEGATAATSATDSGDEEHISEEEAC